MGVGWRTAGVDALQRGIERKNGVKGTNQERRSFLLQSTLTNSCLEQGIQVRGVALCVYNCDRLVLCCHV